MPPQSRIIPATDVRIVHDQWVWPNALSLGEITILEGDPAAGKSAITYDLAARVTRGLAMPGCENPHLPPSGVVVLQGEDNLGAKVVPRLVAAGADLGRVGLYDKTRFPDRQLLLTDDLGEIAAGAAAVQARLLVVDPLSAFLPSFSERAIRQALGGIAALAERERLAVVIVRHLRKTDSANPLYRGSGSIAITAAARYVYSAAPDPTGTPHQHVLADIKQRIEPPQQYRTVIRGGAVAVEWLGVCPDTTTLTAPDVQSDVQEAAYLLYSFLSSGPLPSREIYRLTAQHGHSKRVVDRAKKVMRIPSMKEGIGQGTRWVWVLPDNEALLRRYRERDQAERLNRIRRELAGRQPGNVWQWPACDRALYELALVQRDLRVVRIGDTDYLLRTADAARAPLIEALAQAAAEGDAAAQAAYHDLLVEIGVRR